jgi:hypothetical protein
MLVAFINNCPETGVSMVLATEIESTAGGHGAAVLVMAVHVVTASTHQGLTVLALIGVRHYGNIPGPLS